MTGKSILSDNQLHVGLPPGSSGIGGEGISRVHLVV